MVQVRLYCCLLLVVRRDCENMLEPTFGYAEFLTDSYLEFEEKHYCLGWMCSLLSHTHCRKISEKIRSEFQLKFIDKSFFRDTEGHVRESDDSSQTDLSLTFRFIELQLGFWGWGFRILDLGTNPFVMIIFVTSVL